MSLFGKFFVMFICGAFLSSVANAAPNKVFNVLSFGLLSIPVMFLASRWSGR